MTSKSAASKTPKKDKYARFKIAMIPVLLCVLAYVLIIQSTDKEGTTSLQPSASTQPSGAHSDSFDARAKAHTAWPDVDLQFLTQSKNPFKSYSTPQLQSPSTQRLVSTNAEPNEPSPNSDLTTVARDLSDKPVNYVFQSHDRKLVMLGEQIYERGEHLSDSVRLLDIQDHALILALSGPNSSESQNVISRIALDNSPTNPMNSWDDSRKTAVNFILQLLQFRSYLAGLQLLW